MNLTVCAKICNQCPFSKTSLPGWLGGFSADDILEAQQNESLFSCHLHREEDSKENGKKIESGEHPICRGFLVSAEVSCKMFGQNPKTGKALYDLIKTMTITKEEKESVLSRFTFRKHHE